jgi:hypothetical protein
MQSGHKAVIEQADIVVVAAHSQGVIVGMLMLHELMIGQGRLKFKPDCKIGVLAMAGIHHGPFPDTATDLFQSTKELFQLNHPYLPLSERYMSAVSDLLELDVQIMAMASVMDQVVPLYSGTLHGLYSENLVRAFYVYDMGNEEAFVVRILYILIFLANVGLESDLLVFISGFIRGPLISVKPGTHSTISSDEQTYQSFALWFQHAITKRHSKKNRLTNIAINNKSSVSWCQRLNDQFYFSSINKHLIKVQFDQILALTTEHYSSNALCKMISDNISLLRLDLESKPDKSSSKGMKQLHAILLSLLSMEDQVSSSKL